MSAEILKKKMPASLGIASLGTRNILEKCSWHLWSTDGYLEIRGILRYDQ